MNKSVFLLHLVSILAWNSLNGQCFGDTRLWASNFCVGQELPLVGDFNGDGKDDIIKFVKYNGTSSNGHVLVSLSDGSKFTNESLWIRDFCLKNEIPIVGDFNGDGKDDIAEVSTSESGYINVAISNGVNFRRTGIKWNTSFNNTNNKFAKILCSDFDADGDDDLAMAWNSAINDLKNAFNIDLALSNRTSFELKGTWLSKSSYQTDYTRRMIADFELQKNGPKGILLEQSLEFPRINLYENKGLKFENIGILSKSIEFIPQIGFTGQVDRSDLRELIIFHSPFVYVISIINASPSPSRIIPTTFRIWHNAFTATNSLEEEIPRIGDFNGDGLIDIIKFVLKGNDVNSGGTVVVSINGANCVSIGKATAEREWPNSAKITIPLTNVSGSPQNGEIYYNNVKVGNTNTPFEFSIDGSNCKTSVTWDRSCKPPCKTILTTCPSLKRVFEVKRLESGFIGKIEVSIPSARIVDER